MAYIYTNFDANDDIISEVTEVQTAPIWSDNTATLENFYTSSTQSGSANVTSYLEILDGTGATATTQFSITYGHYAGSGSAASSGDNAATKAVYSQFRNICLPANSTKLKFNFDGTGLDGTGTEYRADDIFAITVNRARYREKVDPGNWELHLVSGSTTIKLIDDSGATADSTSISILISQVELAYLAKFGRMKSTSSA